MVYINLGSDLVSMCLSKGNSILEFEQEEPTVLNIFILKEETLSESSTVLNTF